MVSGAVLFVWMNVSITVVKVKLVIVTRLNVESAIGLSTDACVGNVNPVRMNVFRPFLSQIKILTLLTVTQVLRDII